MSAKQKQEYHLRVRDTGRTTDEPPITSPHDFGIDQTWLAASKDKYPIRLYDWNTYGDLPGFGGMPLPDSALGDPASDLPNREPTPSSSGASGPSSDTEPA